MSANTEPMTIDDFRKFEFRVGNRFCADAFPADTGAAFVRLRIGDWMAAEVTLYLKPQDARALAAALRNAADVSEGAAPALTDERN